ncbi:MAG: MBL fold metallo-hydrolase [Pseudomonadota bacterium]
MKVTMLGSGTSSGVPRVDGDWGECDPANPRNRRRRVSIMVEHEGTRILVDTSPDLREQLLAEGGGRPTAVVWTHEHADHCHGIDDLRPFYYHGQEPIPGFARPRARDELMLRFAFAFSGHQGYPPYMRCDPLPDAINIGGIDVRVIDLPHGQISSAGLRFDAGEKSAVYFTDFNILPDNAQEMIEDCDIWIVDSVRRRPHPTHPHLAQALEWIERHQPRRAVLTHMDQSMDYATLVAELPEHIVPGYDGLVLTP